jgi:tyrosine-specific transport protein
MNSEPPKSSIYAVMLLVIGNMIGAGILALPVNSGLSGVMPTVIMLFFTCGLMVLTAWVIARKLLDMRNVNFDLPTFFEYTLGRRVRWIAIAANLIILYGLLVAYTAGMGSVLQDYFHISSLQSVICVFALATGVTVFGVRVVNKCNSLLVILLWLSFFALVVMTSKHVKGDYLKFSDFRFASFALPNMITAFHFHNIIPTVCVTLNWNKKAILKAILLGSAIGFVMNLIWVVLAVGALPVTGEGTANLMYAYHHQQPAILPLAKIVQSKWFTLSGHIFAFVAMFISFSAHGIALVNFLKDVVMTLYGRSGRLLENLLAFVIPLAIVLYKPNLFLKAVDVVGGIGITIIFGILPGMIMIKNASFSKKEKWTGAFVVTAFVVILALNLSHLTC